MLVCVCIFCINNVYNKHNNKLVITVYEIITMYECGKLADPFHNICIIAAIIMMR